MTCDKSHYSDAAATLLRHRVGLRKGLLSVLLVSLPPEIIQGHGGKKNANDATGFVTHGFNLKAFTYGFHAALMSGFLKKLALNNKKKIIIIPY